MQIQCVRCFFILICMFFLSSLVLLLLILVCCVLPAWNKVRDDDDVSHRACCSVEPAILFPCNVCVRPTLILIAPSRGWPGWVGLGGWLITNMVYSWLVTPDLNTNIARVTLLMHALPLTLSQTAAINEHINKSSNRILVDNWLQIVVMVLRWLTASATKARRDYGWLIGLVCAIVILVLIVFLIVCIIRHRRGHRYSGKPVIHCWVLFCCDAVIFTMWCYA